MLCGKCASFSILDSYLLGGRALEPREGYGLAVDLGTTNVVLALFNLSTGEGLSRHSFMNPQRVFGPDVISRIRAANEGNLEKLRDLIAEALASGIEALLDSKGLLSDSVIDIVVAGNTTMAYLLMGLPCDSLGVAPFEPAYEPPGTYGSMRIVPWLSAFVGGDITAGLLSVLAEGHRCFVLMDLGTNGEIALYDDGKLTVTSTAAGPAFEGAHCGTTNHGNSASTVLDNLAQYVNDGIIDNKGLLRKEIACHGDALFSQKDISDLQLAKSAVRSGFEILLETAELGIEDLDSVYLAGGIGQAIKVTSAVTVGLLPEAIKHRVKPVGNTSLSGAARLLLAPERLGMDMESMRNVAQEINLARHPRFQDLFITNMFF
ncbi:MAG: ASKHA domain-containing protein [Peptococcaceae bacterium]|nr:ASKHA domain-containing protein [Peptococcaceae bacterium]